jgi:hypothetical protein
MNALKRYILCSLVLAVAFFSACENKFDDHNGADNPLLSSTLLEQISANPDLSKFNEYLVKTGYDKVLASSKSFTVWAPTNAALQGVDETVINTDDKLKLFVGNHIANQLFLTSTIGNEPFLRLKTLNGKNVTFSKTSVDDADLVSKDLYVGNGVLHTISSAIIPKISAWEYLQSTNTLQKEELTSLTYEYRDLTQAEVTGIDPNTGTPIYKPGTGVVTTNRFLNRTVTDGKGVLRQPNDISNEDSTFTYIVLTDAAFQAEVNKLSQYYTLGTADSTDSLTKFNVIKDLSFRGILDMDNFPATAYSEGDSVKFHLNKAAVVERIPVSNGMVYVMNSIDYDLGNGTFDMYTKIKPIVIQGETTSPVGPTFLSSKSTAYPTRLNPDGTKYTQMRVTNPATASYWAKYLPAMVNSVKYKVYFRSVREDLVPAAPLSEPAWYPMRVTFKTPLPVTLPYVTKPGLLPVLDEHGDHVVDADNKWVYKPNYDEVYLGEYTVDKFYASTLKSGLAGRLPVYLVANTVTTNGLNDLLLDYIKLVPVPVP